MCISATDEIWWREMCLLHCCLYCALFGCCFHSSIVWIAIPSHKHRQAEYQYLSLEVKLKIEQIEQYKYTIGKEFKGQQASTNRNGHSKNPCRTITLPSTIVHSEWDNWKGVIKLVGRNRTSVLCIIIVIISLSAECVCTEMWISIDTETMHYHIFMSHKKDDLNFSPDEQKIASSIWILYWTRHQTQIPQKKYYNHIYDRASIAPGYSAHRRSRSLAVNDLAHINVLIMYLALNCWCFVAISRNRWKWVFYYYQRSRWVQLIFISKQWQQRTHPITQNPRQKYQIKRITLYVREFELYL